MPKIDVDAKKLNRLKELMPTLWKSFEKEAHLNGFLDAVLEGYISRLEREKEDATARNRAYPV